MALFLMCASATSWHLGATSWGVTEYVPGVRNFSGRVARHIEWNMG
jgi:hypothetical protein